MNELQKRIAVNNSVMQWIDGFMRQNDVAPADMEDALAHAMVQIKDLVMNEVIMNYEQTVEALSSHIADHHLHEEIVEEQPVIAPMEPVVTE